VDPEAITRSVCSHEIPYRPERLAYYCFVYGICYSSATHAICRVYCILRTVYVIGSKQNKHENSHPNKFQSSAVYRSHSSCTSYYDPCSFPADYDGITVFRTAPTNKPCNEARLRGSTRTVDGLAVIKGLHARAYQRPPEAGADVRGLFKRSLLGNLLAGRSEMLADPLIYYRR
jgi:hypothetical protein